jgi:dihydrofolate reductase
MTQTPKVVFSRSLATADAWATSELVTTSVAEFLPELKKRPGNDIVVLGGAALATSVMEANLVDEYRLLVVPTLYGGGTRLFAEGRPHVDLALVEHRPLDTGAVLLRYRRG